MTAPPESEALAPTLAATPRTRDSSPGIVEAAGDALPAGEDPRGALPHRRARRPGRAGRGVPRRGPRGPGPRRRAQADARRRSQRGGARVRDARAAHARGGEPSVDRAVQGLGLVRRAALVRDAVARGQEPRAGGAHHARGGAPHLRERRGGRRGAAREGDAPPGHQAEQHLPRAHRRLRGRAPGAARSRRRRDRRRRTDRGQPRLLRARARGGLAGGRRRDGPRGGRLRARADHPQRARSRHRADRRRLLAREPRRTRGHPGRAALGRAISPTSVAPSSAGSRSILRGARPPRRCSASSRSSPSPRTSGASACARSSGSRPGPCCSRSG